MIGSYLNQDAYRVLVSNWVLYNDEPASSPITLTGDLPSVSFRCRAKVSSATGHTDCAGTLTIGTETLTFSATGQTKITTVNLSALPTVTYSGLDCTILIEAIDSAGAPLRIETAKEVSCRFQDTQKSFRDAQGNWSLSSAIAYVNEPEFVIGTKISYDGYDYDIAQISIMTGLGGAEMGRKLWLTGKTESPDRAIEVEEGAETLTRYMMKAVYDPDGDGIADKAEAIRALDDLPEAPAKGEIVEKDGKMYIAIES